MEKRRYPIDNERLREIRANADWQRLFHALGIRKDEKRSRANDWWGWSPFTEEKTPSFHMNEKGFYCFSTHESGGVVELVQKVMAHRTGQAINCYEAGKWLVENGVSFLPSSDDISQGEGNRLQGKTFPQTLESGDTTKRSFVGNGIPKLELGNEKEIPLTPFKKGGYFRSEKKINRPIRHDLVPLLREQGTHPEFVRRGISRETCEYLGCGFLPDTGRNRPIENRIVFQVQGIETTEKGNIKPIILTHMGRAVSEEQEGKYGKWWTYGGFQKTLELYNINNVLLDDNAINQAKEREVVLIVEGCFDVAKLVEAGIYNVVASFGAHLAEEQIPKVKRLRDRLGVEKFFVWYDRDKAGRTGQEKAVRLLRDSGFEAKGFVWDREFRSAERGAVRIPKGIKDVCDFSVDQIEFLKRSF